MQEPPTTETRLADLESRLAELERKALEEKEANDTRDLALLYRVDNFIEDLRRLERGQMRAFEVLKVGQKDTEKRLDNLETAIATLAAGQQQIIELLLGRSPRND